MFAAIQEMNRQFVELWWECDSSLPDLGPQYTLQAQIQNEKDLLHLLDQVEQMLVHPPRNREEADAAKLRLGTAFRCLAEQALGFDGPQLDSLPSQAYSEASEEFVRKARSFDAKLSMQDIYQAERNAWTAHALQWLMSQPVQLTPAIFAYSLLYPYTDNPLDNPSTSSVTKQAFNERLSQRLTDDSLTPVDAREQAIFDLMSMIEGQYPRSENPRVYESLLEIHHAQSQGLDLLRRPNASAELDVIGLSFYKGGTSVLADGYLVSGSLTEEQRQYTYGQGTFAQLMDDMEDVEEDERAGRLTIYTRETGHQPLDGLANRTFHFGHRVWMGLDCFEVDESLRELIQHGSDLLLIDAIGRTDNHYTPSYLREMETHSPFRFSFLKERRNDFSRRRGRLEKLMERFMAYGKDPFW